MAIRLTDAYPNRTGPANSSYPHGSIVNESAPEAGDGTPLEKQWGNDLAGFMQALLETAGITPDGTPDTAPSSQHTDALLTVTRGVTEVDVAGSSDVTLAVYDNRVAMVRLIGELTADIDVIVPDVARHYVFVNNTTGSFTVTVRTASGTGEPVAQSFSEWLYSDGTNVRRVIESRYTVQVFTAGGTWERPVGCRYVEMEVIGGGGGSSSSASGTTGDYAAGGGGGGGGYARKLLNVAGIASATISVGAGGAIGGSGGNSSWADGTNTIQGNGGGPGAAEIVSTGRTLPQGGVPGAASGGDVNADGQGGGHGAAHSVDSGDNVGGFGGGSALAGGPESKNANTAGQTPSGPGAGASGGATINGGVTGDEGSDGIVIIREFYR